MAAPKKPGKRGVISAHIDKHVGDRLRQLRIVRGWSQEKLGESVGLTFQQIQKYEKGANRISAGLLAVFAEKLGGTVPFFYDGVETANASAITDIALGRRDVLELVRSYHSLAEPVRNRVRELLHALASQNADAAR